jgi:hypothetical protein
MTLHRSTEPVVNHTKSPSMAPSGTWTVELHIIKNVVSQVLRELWRRELDESTWRTAVRWWGWGETPD